MPTPMLPTQGVTDHERAARIQQALEGADLDAVICTLPSHVLLLSGYWPVVGTSLAVAARGAGTLLIVPEDEHELAGRSWADGYLTFQPGGLDALTTAVEAVAEPLSMVTRALKLERGRIGYEGGALFTPASYAAMHFYGAVCTAPEIAAIRRTCSIATQAFLIGMTHLHAGLWEAAAAALFRAPFSTLALEDGDAARRADGFTFCMSGANAAKAYRAYAQSRAKTLASHDLALVHCNASVDGYWTDMTRTYCLGEADGRQRTLYEAVFEARRAALDAVRPGVAAARVDEAARAVLSAHGLGPYFKHATGHGVGFAAINHNARPRLHPRSQDRLECGMVFNIEPAVYLEGYGGIRHCDVVALTENGAEVLTPCQSDLESLLCAW